MHFIKKISENEFIISLFIKPNSKIQQIFEPMSEDNYLTISLRSVPRKSKANIELIKLLKRKLRDKIDQINIVSGHKNQFKTIKLTTFESLKEEDILKSLLS